MTNSVTSRGVQKRTSGVVPTGEGAEREAATLSRVLLLRRLIREFAVLRSTHERMTADIEALGQALQSMEDTDPDA